MTRAFTAADADNAKSWPFQEAKALAKRVEKTPADQPIVFETGYGPSGLPHIGTFGEVARTTMVRRAFELLTGRPTRLIAFSDDMDGMRKVPPTVPNPQALENYMEVPLSRVPDPFGEYDGFALNMNARLRAFLDQFDFDYEFFSATAQYESGAFDATLVRMLEVYDDILEIILPTLGEERRATYSPILPISPSSGRVLYVPLLERDAASGMIVFEDEDGTKVETSVKGGNVKMQWKADWAGRWHALGVDYEMSGEDLTESVRLSNRIVKALGGTPPAGFNYQLFLDEEGKKISKTKGNGITIDEWLTYASPESLALYMFQAPKKAKKLYFDIIPKTADEYLSHLAKYPEQEGEKALDNPVWHIHEGTPPTPVGDITFAMLMNLVSAAGTDDKGVIWGFVRKYVPGTGPETHPKIDELIGYALKYFEDFVKPSLSFRAPTDQERAALEDLVARLEALPTETNDAEALQTEVFSAGKAQEFENLRDWFKAIYEVVFGQSQGPRMGAFIAVYGVAPTVALLKGALERG